MTTLAHGLHGRRVVVCAGAGGVGKTTISAAVALGLAARGQRVVVVTIDPARRLAESLGLAVLDNEPRRVDPARLAAAGIPVSGELWALMLDVKRTFDDLVTRLAPGPTQRAEILANPVYRQLSTAIAGSQEYTAIAKLHDLVADGGYDVVVLDTPPSRNALDFLEAPERLVAFFEGRALATLFAPAGGAMRATGVVLSLLRRVTGVGMLEDLSSFFRLLGAITPGLRRRAADVGALLRDPATAFVVVASPERAAVDEAVFFAGQLDAARMHRAGVVVNRVHELDRGSRDPAATAARLTPALGVALARRVARAHADVQALARRDAAALDRLRGELGAQAVVCLADRERDVHDLEALAVMAGGLLGPHDDAGAPKGARAPSCDGGR